MTRIIAAVAEYLELHPKDPQPRLIKKAAEIVRAGGVIAYPTDSCYALGCHIGDKDPLERIRRLRAAAARGSGAVDRRGADPRSAGTPDRRGAGRWTLRHRANHGGGSDGHASDHSSAGQGAAGASIIPADDFLPCWNTGARAFRH